jgi:hypothetical protein
MLLHALHLGEPQPALAPLPDEGSRTVFSLSLLVMARVVDDAEPADEQPGLAFELDAYDPDAFCGFELGVSTSSDEETASGFGDFEATVSEVYLGARKTWGAGRNLHPYAGVGLAYVKAEAELSGFGSADDSSLGGYAHGGVYWTLGRHFNLGVDLKALVGTDLDFGDADYVQGGAILGWSF